MIGALTTVYLIWGSIYLGIRLVIEEVDVFQAMAQRFFLAGLLLGLVLVWRGGWSRLRIERRQIPTVVLVGVLLLGLGNGLQALGQVKGLPSGVTALIVALVPIWAGLLRVATGDRPPRLTVVGIVAGFVGLVVLVVLGRGAGGSYPLIGIALVMGSSLSWTIGGYLQGRLAVPRDIFVTSMYQQFVAAACSCVLAVGFHETFSVDYSFRGWVALAYLVVVCSVIGFTAFTWLLGNAPLSLVSTHAYVNPVVAVLLGWAVLSESIGLPVLVGGGIVVAAVVLIISSEQRATGAARIPPHVRASDGDDSHS